MVPVCLFGRADTVPNRSACDRVTRKGTLFTNMMSVVRSTCRCDLSMWCGTASTLCFPICTGRLTVLPLTENRFGP